MEDYTSDHGKPSKRILSMFEIIESFVLAIVCVILVFVFFAKLSIVEGESMEDTLFEGDALVVGNVLFSYTPDKEDIVIIHGNLNYSVRDNTGKYVQLNFSDPIVKRVIATEGDLVEIRSDFKVYVNGQKVNDDHGTAVATSYYIDPDNYFLEYDKSTMTYHGTVPKDHVFVLGDNRGNSLDSRAFGFIHEKLILGKAIFRLNRDFGSIK